MPGPFLRDLTVLKHGYQKVFSFIKTVDSFELSVLLDELQQSLLANLGLIKWVLLNVNPTVLGQTRATLECESLSVAIDLLKQTPALLL
jgi:hypothetical protein